MIPFISIRFGCVHDKRKTKQSENEGTSEKCILFRTRRWWFRAQAALVVNSLHNHTPTSLTLCWDETIYPEYNTHRVWVCHQYNIFNLLKRSRFWFSLRKFFICLFWVWSNLCLFMTYGAWKGEQAQRERRREKEINMENSQ